ncbi:indolepyruvate ferredoxin oxidoreductase family protein [Thermopetrobacter sp. TC1]|uniref:indolepyruvate ferredoxin oxidoreductase family protein n=1 Tax=Thermopetrobacter sp. TC1 TaxID=1495045 RepID=UPI00056F667B|nr:indolepyruvate ferredoxin oxidoreductase family protein [Thermopetrobacter sp. TC1]
MARHVVSLSDRYDLSKTRVMLNGSQAIVRLMLMQKARDEAAGLNTGGYVTGYRGSPLGALDVHFEQAEDLLRPKDILFQPGLNEELAATAIWGAQQINLFGEGAKDGVFCAWYGKGPGVDRSGDVFRHANIAGTARHGGVLVLMGDDHAAESSTVAHQSDFALIDAMIPILNPSGVQEIIDFGLLGYGLSRYSGCWVGLKCLHDTVESTAVVDAGPDRGRYVLPDDHALPPDGLNIRWPDERLAAEKRLHVHKLEAAKAFARANDLYRTVWSAGDGDVIGIISAGKSWLDVRQALIDLGIDEARARSLGLRLLKAGMIWPLDEQTIRAFARGLKAILVVEEKRAIMEPQVRDILYGLDDRPVVIGKRDAAGAALLPSHGILDANMVAQAIGALLSLRGALDTDLEQALKNIARRQERAERIPDDLARSPWFCAGCPHNTSTRLPEGARGYAGIGCHWLVQLMPERRTLGATQMGGEGANWIGEAPFSRRTHVFQNLGDGTYAHSGILAIRAARAAGVNITFKILYNDAVAMTGGQAIDGGITVPDIAWQVRAEGIERIAVVMEEPGRWSRAAFPPGTTFHQRNELDSLQKELMQVPGVSVLIHDQVCAAEKRRRRRRGTYPEPSRFVVINERVCEGCGDCGVQSNCVAIVPVETSWGRKRQIDQSVCNADYTCLDGLCPAMVTVEVPQGEGRKARKTGSGDIPAPPPVPAPALPSLARPWAIAIAGIGGTGVVTISQIIGHAAHIAGLGAGVIDMSGISQKNGTVISHVKIAARPEDVPSIRIADGSADLLLGCDVLTTASRRILRMAHDERTGAAVNLHKVMPGQFATNPDLDFSVSDLLNRISSHVRNDMLTAVDTTKAAKDLLGDGIFANMMLLGAAWQMGLVPVDAESIEDAIRLNGRAVDRNIAAFHWGRALAHDSDLRTRFIPETDKDEALSLKDVLEEGRKLLTAWQDEQVAESYAAFVTNVAEQERARTGRDDIARMVARQLARLTALKDEYEVARLYTEDRAFFDSIAKQFGEEAKVRPWLAPPLLSRRDENRRPQKRAFGPWIWKVMPLLARMKSLRGSRLDPFGWSKERRAERRIAEVYREAIRRAMKVLGSDTHETVLKIAADADRIRGFGPVRLQAFERWRAEAEKQLQHIGA